MGIVHVRALAEGRGRRGVSRSLLCESQELIIASVTRGNMTGYGESWRSFGLGGKEEEDWVMKVNSLPVYGSSIK